MKQTGKDKQAEPSPEVHRTRDLRINAPPEAVAKALLSGGAAPRYETRKKK